jgi:hypothetical protein
VALSGALAGKHRGIRFDPELLYAGAMAPSSGWRAHALQSALRLRIGDDGAGDGLQFAEIGVAVAQLDLHGETGNNLLAVELERENDVAREDFSVRAFETSLRLKRRLQRQR